MNKAEIPFLSLTHLRDLIKNREISPVEVVESYLDRIDCLNDRLYAYLTVCREEALQAARESEEALARGEYKGTLHGVPVAVKDQLNTAGIRTTSGTPIFNDFVPDEDATVITKLKSAGAILLGKLNMTEFGTTSLSHAFHTARNPWDLERFTGGSSSGSGAATAAFMCATSLGEDTGGSVRGPGRALRLWVTSVRSGSWISRPTAWPRALTSSLVRSAIFASIDFEIGYYLIPLLSKAEKVLMSESRPICRASRESLRPRSEGKRRRRYAPGRRTGW